jgi:hypothetical protein
MEGGVGDIRLRNENERKRGEPTDKVLWMGSNPAWPMFTGGTPVPLTAGFSPIAFGNQTISTAGYQATHLIARETHGFAPLLRSKFAFIGAITLMKRTSLSAFPAVGRLNNIW